MKTLGDLTVYARDRDDFSTGTSHNHLRLSIGGTGNNKLKAEIAQDIDSSNYMSAESTSTISTGAWTYVVYSFELKTVGTTDIVFFIANSPDTAATKTVFYIDESDYKGFIALERTATSTYTNQFNGFIYDM